MPHAVPFEVLMRFAHGLALNVFTRVILAPAAHSKLGFQCRLLRNVTAQLLTQFVSVAGVNLSIVAAT